MERSALRVLLLCVAVLALLRPLLAQAHDVHFGTKSWYATGAAHAHREHGHASLPAALQSRLAEKCKVRASRRSRPALTPRASPPLQLQSLYMVIRHASRWPTKKHMDKYAKLVAGNWTSAFANNALDEGLLTLHGQQEAFDLGTRVRRSYAELLSQPYHPRVFDFRSSSIPRALQTATRFAAGVFGEGGFAGAWRQTSCRASAFCAGQAFAVASESLQHDLHLRFHENCPRYRAHKPIAIAQSCVALRDVKLTPRVGAASDMRWTRVCNASPLACSKGPLDQSPPQSSSFSSSSPVSRLHNSTNLHAPTAALTSKSLAYLWSACKFERTALGLPDNACAFFSAQDARELEYVEDVKDFWEKGFGFVLGCCRCAPRT
jgi:hypothetical protein